MKNSIQRIFAVMLRHIITWPRELESLLETFWWPSFDILIWGLMSSYLGKSKGIAVDITGFMMGGLILWMFVYRSQQETGFAFLKEVWERNFINLLTTPLSIAEYTIATVTLGFAKLLLSALWLAILAKVLFTFNILTFGWYLIPFVINLLIVGWWAGFFINGLVFRYGNRVQAFIWSLVYLLQPFAAVFYPVATLPSPVQTIARLLPASYVFEGMRSVLTNGSFDLQSLLTATVLNGIYLAASLWFYIRSYEYAKENGMILKYS